ncbi:MAG: GAF domain-containing sensor histidine kinase [Acidimicrobiia bacterium]
MTVRLPSITPPVPPNEDARLAALARYDIMDTDRDPAFDRITDMASRIFKVPIVLVSFVDEDRTWFKSACGLDSTETPRSHAFCADAICQERTLVIEDATQDPRTVDDPLVTGPPHIRFYAGAPLMTPEGYALGTLCLIDSVPRTIDAEELHILEGLADLVIDELELRLALENARRSEGERVELIATVAHEVRNPLTGALGLAELLADETDTEDAETLRIIRDSIRDADRIIEDLLTLSRFDRGSFEVQTRPVPVRPEVGGVLQSFDPDFRNRVAVSVPADTVVDADPLRLRQIVRNLVSNAQRYGGEVVSIEVVRRDGEVHLHVVDDGDGVDEAITDLLFQTFSRGHAGLHNANSSGLGLAVSRRLAKAMGGDLTYSRGNGRTVFTLTLPSA